MPLVLTVMFVLSLFGVTVWQFAATDVLHVERDELKMQAHYLARSGGDAMADYLMRAADVQVAHSVITRTDEHSPATGSLGQDKTFRVNVIGSPMNSMTIISQGIRNGVTRTLAFDLTRLDAREIFNKGIFTKGDLDVSLMSPLSGTLASAGEVTAPRVTMRRSYILMSHGFGNTENLNSRKMSSGRIHTMDSILMSPTSNL